VTFIRRAGAMHRFEPSQLMEEARKQNIWASTSNALFIERRRELRLTASREGVYYAATKGVDARHRRNENKFTAWTMPGTRSVD